MGGGIIEARSNNQETRRTDEPNKTMKIKHLIPLILAPVFLTSCEKSEKKETKNTPEKMAPKSTPTSAKQQPKKTGIPAVEAARHAGDVLKRNAQKSQDLLDNSK